MYLRRMYTRLPGAEYFCSMCSHQMKPCHCGPRYEAESGIARVWTSVENPCAHSVKSTGVARRMATSCAAATCSAAGSAASSRSAQVRVCGLTHKP